MIGVQSDTLAWLLLAQRDNWVRLGDRFTGRHLEIQTEDILGGLLLIAAGVLLFFGLNYARKLSERLNSTSQPRDVFTLLCEAHQLSRADRRLVKDIAERAGYERPADVFVRPELFRGAAAKKSPAMKALGDRLFARPVR